MFKKSHYQTTQKKQKKFQFTFVFRKISMQQVQVSTNLPASQCVDIFSCNNFVQNRK